MSAQTERRHGDKLRQRTQTMHTLDDTADDDDDDDGDGDDGDETWSCLRQWVFAYV